ncbi:DUF6663 family protein [Haloplanus sp. GCM10025708]|uniref:DUF6663 family protein n=1 Tax=Haloplanus sp. GCM10025708 TaxID=3252679 RepID=UPI0036183E18
MDPTTNGEYRVLSRRTETDLVFVDRSADESYDPVTVTVPESAPTLRPGYAVDATLSWPGSGPAELVDADVRRRTRFEFLDDVTGLFEAARETWREASAAGDGVNSRVTRNTDGDPNGALYVFANPPGGPDVFEELQSGTLPSNPSSNGSTRTTAWPNARCS